MRPMKLRAAAAVIALVAVVVGVGAAVWYLAIGAVVAYVAWMFIRGPIHRDRDTLPGFGRHQN